jgi:hypothetical protein
MRSLLDANLSRSAVSVAARVGDEALHVTEVGLGDASDEVIAAYARAHGLVLVRRDLDFADVRIHDPAVNAGVVVLQRSEDAVLAARLSKPPRMSTGSDATKICWVGLGVSMR